MIDLGTLEFEKSRSEDAKPRQHIENWENWSPSSLRRWATLNPLTNPCKARQRSASMIPLPLKCWGRA
jgi:hypothetical protein